MKRFLLLSTALLLCFATAQAQTISADVLNIKEATPAQLDKLRARNLSEKPQGAPAPSEIPGYYKYTYYLSSDRAADPTTLTNRQPAGLVKVNNSIQLLD